MSKITFFRKVSKMLLLSIATISLCLAMFIQPVSAIYATDINVADLHSLANQEREKVGLALLSLSNQLSEAAQNKANHMIANDYWDHYAPDGTTPWSFIEDSGYDYKTAGENLAEGFSYSSDVVAGWMNSPTHKANVLKDSYVDVGYAVLNGTILGEKTTLVVAMYGTPKSYDVSSQAKTVSSSVAVSMIVGESSENSGTTLGNSNGSVDGVVVETKKPGLVKGLMASLPVSAYLSTSKDMKLFIMTVGIIILFVSVRFLLFSICNRRGVHYIWLKKRPVSGSMLLFISFAFATASSLGFAFL